MKKCPFCAEEIQDEAVKCRFCGSSLTGQPGAGESPSAAPRPFAAADVLRAAAGSPATSGASTRKVLYTGSPSWRAYFGTYFLVMVGTIGVTVASYLIAKRNTIVTSKLALAIAIPLAIGVVVLAALHFYRRSMIFRITSSNIETERGLLSKKIDVLELWRCRDVRYVQSLLNRILGVAHIEVTTTDVTTPQLTLVGMPASRQLFEQIRDSIELQRQSHNVVGMVH